MRDEARLVQTTMETTMTYVCEDCEKPHQSIKAAMLCDCDRYDRHGRPVYVKGSDWLP